MTRRVFLGMSPILLKALFWTPSLAQARALQTPSVGRVERLSDVPSRFVDSRPIEVWLPPSYDPDKRYAVLYMHDGQMLFDAQTTWNRKAWRVDAAAARLMAEGLVQDFIVVGPWNNGRFRHAEYFPGKFLPHLPKDLREELIQQGLQGGSRSEAYLRFLVEELKPAIDARYATRREREATFLMGSSMGGLISAYALCEYPRVFGGAACLSTHWIGSARRNDEIPSAAIAYLRDALPDPRTVKWWMDRGTLELDAQYAQAQVRIDALMAEKGFVPGTRYQTRVYEGTGHNEDAWAQRLHEPLGFLL